MRKISILVLVIVVLGLVYWAFGKKASAPVLNESVSEVSNVGENMTPPGSMVKDEIKMEDGTMMKASSGHYDDYSQEEMSLHANDKIVLFFKASWCPSCKAVDADITKNLKNIPAGISILKVDYDKSSEMKKKYGVSYQHTFVQIDKDGNQITKWSGGSTLSELLTRIK